MKIKCTFAIISLFLISLLITGCGESQNLASTPEQVVTSYLEALVSKNSESLSLLSCADWEPNAIMELDSFQAVDVRLEGLMCKSIGMDADVNLVNCQGKIIATYNGEDQDIDLSARNYRVIEQDGENLVCGYQ